MVFSQKIPDLEGGLDENLETTYIFHFKKNGRGERGGGVNKSGRFPDFTGFSILRASLRYHLTWKLLSYMELSGPHFVNGNGQN